MGWREEDVAEFDQPSTIEALEDTISSLGFRVVRIGHARSLCQCLARGEHWDLVFNICEGTGGRSREAHVPSILEAHGIPFTFSDPLVCAVTLDKAITKRLVRDAGLPTPRFHVVRRPADVERVDLSPPLFAKPLAEGTGKGIDLRSRLESTSQLREVCAFLLERYLQPVIVEEYLPGREFTTGILGTGAGARAIGTMEIEMLDPASKGIYSFEIKETCERTCRYSRLAEGPLKLAIEQLAVESHKVLECRDASRVDIKLDPQGNPSFLEINPLPGLHPTHSDLPMIATWEGMQYSELLRAIIDSAMTRVEASHGR
jgi:D-alanine-D-alanine ligase